MKATGRASNLLAASLCIVSGAVVFLWAYREIKRNDPVFLAAICFAVLMCSIGVAFLLAGYGILSTGEKDRDQK